MNYYTKANLNNPKNVIDELSLCYLNNKSRSESNYQGPYKRYENDRLYSEDLINRIESCVESLNDNDKLIIKNEVILGKKGDWYAEYISQSTYYRYRELAYYNFLSCLVR